MFEDVKIEHYGQKSKQCKDDKEFHGLCIGLTIVLILAFAKYKWLVGKAKGLYKHGHNHGYLAGSTINTELNVGFGSIRLNVWEDDTVGYLIANTGHT